MDLDDVVRRRRMVRAYDPKRPVPAEVMRALLEHAVHAPSAGFSQGWDFLVLDAPADRDRFWAATTDPDAQADPWLVGMRTAPLLVVCFSDKQRYLDRYAEPDKGWTDRDEARWAVPFWHTDTAMAALLMLLTAVDRGLGAAFFGVPVDRIDAVRVAFAVPADRMPIGVVSVGYPAPDRRSPSLRRGRRPLTEVTHHGRWGTPYDAGAGAGR